MNRVSAALLQPCTCHGRKGYRRGIVPTLSFRYLHEGRLFEFNGRSFEELSMEASGANHNEKLFLAASLQEAQQVTTGAADRRVDDHDGQARLVFTCLSAMQVCGRVLSFSVCDSKV